MPTDVPGTEFLDGQPISTRNLETGDVLYFENGEWTNLNKTMLGLQSSGGQNATAISGAPVSVTSPTTGDILEYVGQSWINRSKETVTDGGNF